MKIAAIVLLILTIALEFLALSGANLTLNAWAFIVGFASAGLALAMYARQVLDGPYRTGALLISGGYLLRAFGEWGWLQGFLNEENGYSLVANAPYYLSSLAYAFGAYQIYTGVNRLMNLGPRWVGGALLASVLTVAILTLPYLAELEVNGEFWIETIDNVISGFAAFLLIVTGYLTLGGTLSRWTAPLAAAFAAFLIGNITYTLIADTYDYGTLPDFFWMAEVVILLLMTALSGSVTPEEDDF